MPRTFNIAGPCRTDLHYMLPPLERLPQAPGLVEQMAYFVVHAPRQTGKTTVIEAWARELTATGRYAAVAFSCERAKAAGEDYGAAQRDILDQIRWRADQALAEELRPPAWPDASEGGLLQAGLSDWAQACPLPLVLFFDEIDTLQGVSLISVLSQLRTGYTTRPEWFPASVILCGMRDVKDYKAASGGDVSRFGSSSPFNIKAGSFRLGDFTVEEVGQLYGQYSAETGQEFTSDGVEFAFELTRGQPWLVNALALEATERMGVPADESIGPRRLDAAKDRLIAARATHLDSLAARLNEPRVQRILQPLLVGELLGPMFDTTFDDDLSYARDLGLVAQDNPLRIANPIYHEVIPRVLGGQVETAIDADPRAFIDADGRLNFDELLAEFVAFWKRHGEVLVVREAYSEAAPHLVLLAFMYRLINGGGHVGREEAAGRGRSDLVIRWPYNDAAGTRVWQQEVIEVKVWHPGKSDPLARGLEQLDGYLDRFDRDTGALIIFDRRLEARPLPERTGLEHVESPAGRVITLIRA